jgi:hypothetical protein
MKVWTKLTESELHAIANEVGVTISEHGSETFAIPKVGRAYSFGLRPAKQLGKIYGDYKYQRTNASGFNPERRVHAVCWHGWRDFMLALYKHDPDARIKTAIADYRGRDDFLEKYPRTANLNIGSMMYPMQMHRACNCAIGGWLIDLSTQPNMRAYSMKQGAIRSCPFVIIDPSHYRADGTCKCNDPAEQERMIREWDYTPADFAGKGI